MDPLDLVGLTRLMELSDGNPEIVVALMDGPVATDHPDLAGQSIRAARGRSAACSIAGSAACLHGTFVAGILSARRGSPAPAICPGCTLLVRPIFAETAQPQEMPSVTPGELAATIAACVDAGARVINLSASFTQPSTRAERELEEALGYAAGRGVVVVAAAGNQGALGSSAITRHPWVIPVVAYDLRGTPSGLSNLGSSAGRRGLGAPGEDITSLGADGGTLTLAGTSFAAPFVSGAVALLWSLFPEASAADLVLAVTRGSAPEPRRSVVPPLLDARAAYRFLERYGVIPAYRTAG